MTGPGAHPSTGEDSISLAMARTYLRHTVDLIIDRPYGSLHPVHGFRYEVDYGYVPGTLAPDGEELDAYYLGPRQPLATAHGLCVAIVHRHHDDDDKLVIVPDGTDLPDTEIAAAIAFQEVPDGYEILRH